MPAALQCPDCGHQEMLDNLGGVTTFRCGGCGRALKVPAQFRPAPGRRGGAPVSAPPESGERTQAMPKVSADGFPAGVSPRVVAPGPVAAGAAAGAAVVGAGAAAVEMPPVVPPSVAPGAERVATPDLPTGRSPIAVAGDEGGPDAPVGPGGVESAARPGPRPIPPGSLRPPLILRLVLWAIALPVGSLLVFAMANRLNVLTKAQLEDTFLLAGWGRFLPIARLLPFCALATALIVQLGVFGLERLRAHNLRRGPSGRGRPRRGPTRPLAPGGGGQPGTNGARARDRLIS